jgi:putative methyltransferase (TIGR04325 family)
MIPDFLKAALPSSARRLARRKPRPTWDGIYAHLRDVPAQRPGYDQAERVHELVLEARTLLDQVRQGRQLRLWHGALCVVAAAAARPGVPLRIVDFGGGMASGYIHLIASKLDVDIDYRVIDLPQMCEAGNGLFEGDPHVKFHTSLDHVDWVPDIVYASSVLQYIEEYRGQLRKLAALGAPWILLAKLPVGEFATFATRQLNLPGQVIPYWFFNRAEIVEHMSACGYRLVLDDAGDIEYDQSNFDPAYRIGRMRIFLLARN